MNISLFFGGCILAAFFLWLDMSGVAGIVFVIGAAVAALPRKYTTGELVNKPHKWTRAEIEADLEQIHKDMTGNYTAGELKAMEQAERDNYNRNISAAAWWQGGDTYTDYDGNIRKT
jgi:xanthine dehydrogenase iron-sulfur cluster and FAD-binding subunit A